MKRITVEMVKEAYAKTGLRPYQSRYYAGKFENGRFVTTCACGIGAIYAATDEIPDTSNAYYYACSTFGAIYTDGFMYGFDNRESPNQDSKYWNEGFEDGRSAWEAVKP